jgi:hypothetical protein
VEDPLYVFRPFWTLLLKMSLHLEVGLDARFSC